MYVDYPEWPSLDEELDVVFPIALPTTPFNCDSKSATSVLGDRRLTTCFTIRILWVRIADSAPCVWR